MKSFLILFAGHVGSSWLCSLLNSSEENFHVAFEPFMQISNKRINKKIDQQLERKIKNEFAKMIFCNPSINQISSNQNQFSQYINFYKENPEFDKKISAHHVDYKYIFCKARITEITPYIKNQLIPNEKVLLIYLRRQNKIKQAVSNIKRLNLGLGHFNTKQISPAVSIEPTLILEKVNKFKERDDLSKSFFESVNTPKISITYENLLNNFQSEIKKIGDFMDVELKPENLKGNYAKVTHDNLREALENYDEVKSFFENSIYQGDFEN